MNSGTRQVIAMLAATAVLALPTLSPRQPSAHPIVFASNDDIFSAYVSRRFSSLHRGKDGAMHYPVLYPAL